MHFNGGAIHLLHCQQLSCGPLKKKIPPHNSKNGEGYKHHLKPWLGRPHVSVFTFSTQSTLLERPVEDGLRAMELRATILSRQPNPGKQETSLFSFQAALEAYFSSTFGTQRREHPTAYIIHLGDGLV